MSTWAILGCDDGVTVETTGEDPEALADRVASWAQQEADRWPDMGLLYMLVDVEDIKHDAALHVLAGGFGVDAEGCPRCQLPASLRRSHRGV
jgi:hypothetical protein